MKAKKEHIEEGLHQIENEKRPRAFRKKRGGVRLKAKYHRRITKTLASFCVAAVLCLGVFGVNAVFFQKPARNEVAEGFVTVAYPLPTDGSTPADYASADLSDALKNIGYMNTRFMQQENWYLEMHGTVKSVALGITINQNVETYKQFDDGVLIMTDVTSSDSSIGPAGARQFCYVGDRVLWRLAKGGKDTYHGIDTEWRDGDPYGNMDLEEFESKNGLPATAFSVYIINEETLLAADPVVTNEDGTFSQTYYLNPASDMAPAHYINQMIFTGGIAEASFDSIAITYTFDATWQVLKSEISESYSAKMAGIAAGCTSTSVTVYEYDTPKAETNVYGEYFSEYAAKPATGAPERGELTATECLGSAFAPVLSGPVNFRLALTVNGAPVEGIVSLNAAAIMGSDTPDLSKLEVRALLRGIQVGGRDLGDVFVQVEGGNVYLRLGSGIRLKTSLNAVLALVGDASAGLGGLDVTALTEQLGSGTFTPAEDGKSALLEAKLDLFGLQIPLTFNFLVDEAGSVQLGHVATELSFNDIPVLGDLSLGAALSFTEESVPALTDAEKGSYFSLDGVLGKVESILAKKQVTLGLDLTLDGAPVTGIATIDFTGETFGVRARLRGLSLAGVAFDDIFVEYAGDMLYVNYGGKAKVKLSTADLAGLLGGAMPAENAFDLTALLQQILAGNFQTAADGREISFGATLGLLGYDLPVSLRLANGADGAFSHIFADVTLAEGIPLLGGKKIGAELTIQDAALPALTDAEKGSYFSLDGVLGKVENILAKKQVTLGLDLTLDGAPVTGTATIDFAGETLGVRARLSGLSLAGVAFDDIFVEYAGNMLYVNYGGKAKVKLSASDLAGLLGGAMPAESTFDLAALLQQILAGNFQTAADGREISFGATLGLLGYDLPVSLRLVNGADGAFSHIFADVALAEGIPLLGGKKIGAELTIQDAALPALTDAEKGSYYDLAPVLEMLPEILENKAISLGGSVKIGSKDGSVALTLQNGVLSWKDGLRLSFDLGIGADTIEQTLSLSLNTKTQRVQLKYGDVGVDVAYDQLEKLTAAFDAVLDRIRRESQYFIEGFDLDAALDGLLAGRSLTEFVGEITGIDLSALEGVLNGLGGTGEGNALEDLLADLSIVAPHNGGFVALSLGAFTAELGYKNGALTVLLPEAELGSCTLTASLKAGTSDGNVREWNEKDFLTVDDFVELIDFAGAAVATVSAGDVALSFETLTAKSGSSTFAVQGSLAYHMGSLDGSEGRGPFFTLDQDGKSLIANPNAFLYIDLWLEDLAKTDAASDLYLELWMFDDGSTGEGAVYEPVFYVILSHYKPDSDQYDPFTFKVAAGEILTLLASGISLVETPLKDLMISTGIPEDTVNVLFDAIDEYVISKRLVGEELGQVGAIGEMLVKTLGLEKLLSGGSVAAGDGADAAAKAAVGNYLTALTLKHNGDKTVFDLRLDSDLLFGGSGKKDLSVTLTKEGAVGASYLSEVTLGGIYSGDSCTDASFRFSRSPLALDNATKTITQGGTQYAVLDDAMAFEFAGADELIKAIARSATHKTESGKYELNKLIHISGKATIKIDGLDWLFGSAELGIDGLAISFGENGEVTANAKISYSTGGLGGIAFASSGYTELTIKGDMVYMRRCNSDGSYRDSNAMTLDTFMGDILGQVAYILNFSNTVKGFLPDNVGGSSSDNSGKDLGSQVKGILSGYAYDANYQGGGTKRWQFVLNGGELTGALDDIVIGLMTNANGALSALDVGTGISVLSINANLTLDNPGDEWGGKTDQTQDISGLIPDLYNVTIIAPASLGSAWKQNADGTYSRTVQMFKDRPIKFVYGDDVREQKVTEGENIFDLTTLTDGRIQWQNSTFSYTAGGCTIEIALTPDTVVYNSTIEFSMGGETAKSFTAEFDKATTLYATPTAEGYTFLGWYVLENGTPKKVTELAYSGTGGASTTVEAMWVKDITGGTIVGERSEKKSGIDKTLYYTAQVSVEGGTLSGAYSDQFALAASVTCRFRLALTDHASATTDQFANGTFAEVEASHSYWASAFSYCDQIYAEVQLIYRLNGVDVCVVKATLFAKYDTSVAAGVSSVEVQDPSVTVYN